MIGNELINKGGQLIERNAYEGEKIIKKGVLISPDEAIAYYNLGLAMHQQRKIKCAIKAYKTAIIKNKGIFVEAINNLSQDLLLIGEWDEGWKLYENRMQTKPIMYEMYEELFGKPWEGEMEKRKFSELVVVAEQGFGDTIQFCRFVLELQKKGYKARLFCQEELRGLLKKTKGLEKTTSSLLSQSQEVLWCPLLSLPGKLKVRNSVIPNKNGYLKINQEKITEWKEKLKKKERKLLIAIHWQGNPKFEKRLYSKGRSMPVEVFNYLNETKGVEFVSIQKGNENINKQKNCKLQYVEGQKAVDESYSFEDTAAVLMNCDLLISADSSVVHLAGALKVPTWIAISWIPEWRWGLEGSKTDWYESAVLYRQEIKGEWKCVMKKIANDLQSLARDKIATIQKK